MVTYGAHGVRMKYRVAKEGLPFIVVAALVFGLAGGISRGLGAETLSIAWYLSGGVVAALLLFFFRDPGRTIIPHPDAVVSGADGVVRSVERMCEDTYLGTETVRISVFLSLFDVHVNRAPMAGQVQAVAYEPGKHLFAFLDAASEYNEHSSIFIQGPRSKCLVRQIVGPVARRVVCWLKKGEAVEKGERIGIMKFGSRLDIYLPGSDVTVEVKKGDRVRAGETVIAKLKPET